MAKYKTTLLQFSTELKAERQLYAMTVCSDCRVGDYCYLLLTSQGTGGRRD